MEDRQSDAGRTAVAAGTGPRQLGGGAQQLLETHVPLFGEAEPTLKEALGQLQMAFVQMNRQAGEAASPD